MVSLDGSSYVYTQTIATAGNQPPNAAYWQVVADRGPTGTGTTGNNTPYNATTWDGQLDAPSRNAVRDVIETLAKLTDIAGLAPLTSPVFGGTPSRSTAPAAGDNSTQLPTTSWVRSYAAPLDSPALLNNPSAPTQPISDRSTKLATTGHVSNKIDAALGAVVIAGQSAPVALDQWELDQDPIRPDPVGSRQPVRLLAISPRRQRITTVSPWQFTAQPAARSRWQISIFTPLAP
jgi:hypothetical protein